MLPPDVVRQVRRLQLRSRRVVANLLGGEYHSVFKGAGHAQRLLRDILFFQPAHRGTGLRAALDALPRIQKRRAIVFLFSDFGDGGYERALRLAGRKHDLIAVWVRDPLEEELPDVGLLELQEAETGEQRLIDTGSAAVRAAFLAEQLRHGDELQRLARGAGVDLIDVSTAG